MISSFVMFVASVTQTFASTDQVLRPATYMSGCPYADNGSIKVGQVIFGASKIDGLVFDEKIIARKEAPFIPEGYVLIAGSGAAYLFANKEHSILRVHAGSFTLLARRPEPTSALAKRITPFLRENYAASGVFITPCFSRPWDGSYPQKPAAPTSPTPESP